MYLCGWCRKKPVKTSAKSTDATTIINGTQPPPPPPPPPPPHVSHAQLREHPHDDIHVQNGVAGGGGDSVPTSSCILPAPPTVVTSERMELDSTGNPRNKCALQPGHSLMDWIRLGNTPGTDLAGNRGIARPITLAELATHCTPTDAWMAVHGKCYNVTRYMAFHPGGRDELMRGVGRDATRLFDEAHAWVNYEQMLAKCYLGPLRAPGNFAGGANGSSASSSGAAAKPASLMAADSRFKLPLMALAPASTQTSPTRGTLSLAAEAARRSISVDKCASLPASPTTAEAPDGGPSMQIDVLEAAGEPEIVPRFDWMQRTDALTLVFYTRALCNPGWSAELLDAEAAEDAGRQVTVRVFAQRSVHVFVFVCANAVRWPCRSKVSFDTGKIELIFTKTEPQLWTSFGLLDRRKVTDLADITEFEYDVRVCQSITPDSYAVRLKPRRRVLQYVPVGYHLRIGRSDGGHSDATDVERSYTPVPPACMPGDEPLAAGEVPLLVKRYAGGVMSGLLTCTPDIAAAGRSLRLSQPRGAFSLYKTRLHTRVAMLAAGSGLTPMLSVLEYMLERTSNKMESITLFYFNKRESDIWCRQYLAQLTQKDQRLHVIHYLSDTPAPPDWPAEHTGRISASIVAPLALRTSQHHSTYAFVCGPPPFNDECKRLLATIGLDASRAHVFH